MGERLGRAEWVGAGLEALARGGVDSVRVEPLARALGVTKGSFYWHFRDRGELLSALLDAWAERTEVVIALAEAGGGDAAGRLRALCGIVMRAEGRLDVAFRAWSGQAEDAAAARRRVDARRLGYVEGLFGELGFGGREARARAQVLFDALVGQYFMGAGPGERLPDYLDILLPMLVRR